MSNETKKPINLLRKAKLLQKIQISNAALYSWMQKSSPYYVPTLPKPIRISGGRSVFWIEEEIDRWLETYMSQRDEKIKVSIGEIEFNQERSSNCQKRQSPCRSDMRGI